ncbi:hypothetical protein BAE44_0016616 [Dichanthelium oligosanthes]|uniref:Dirigent protein n=1 Tax=Dichanthelium oligosanthes TaxID=888268 RepID=A0A1E5VBC2_9POAL|nr:hypothetical protein BAE44_0016616 [Dichanthelium oligosanthes]
MESYSTSTSTSTRSTPARATTMVNVATPCTGLRGARVAGRVGGLSAIGFVFSDYGEYTGSALATQGRISSSGPSERAIVSGTGALRFARGYMDSRLLSATDTAIVVVFDMYFTLAH